MTPCHTSQPCHAASDGSRDISPGPVTMCVAGGAPLRPERHAHYHDGWPSPHPPHVIILAVSVRDIKKEGDGPSPHPPHVIILAVSVRDNEKEGDTGIGSKLKFQT